MVTRRAAFAAVLGVLALCAEVRAQNQRQAGPSAEPAPPHFILIRPTAAYNARLRAARASSGDYFWNELEQKGETPTYANVKDFLAPLKYVNAPWRYFGVILSPEGSIEKMRVTEVGSRIDAGLTRQMPWAPDHWVLGNAHLWVFVGSRHELFGLDEHRQQQPHYLEGYLPVLHAGYEDDGVLYEETVFASKLIWEYRSPTFDEPGIAAYIRVTAKSGPGEAAFRIETPPVTYGGLLDWKGGFRDDQWTDAQDNDRAWFSRGAHYDPHTGLVEYRLKKGESAYVIFPHSMQLAGTRVRADKKTFDQALAEDAGAWRRKLARGGEVSIPEEVVMDAYRSLLIGDWQVSIGDELPYGMFSSYEGNAYAEMLQAVEPLIEYGYFDDARRFIQPLLEYPLADHGVGLHVCANQLELAAYYYALSGDAAFIRANEARLIKLADYFLAHRQKNSGLVLDGYANDLPHERVVNLSTNSNGWRAIRDFGVTLNAVGETKLASQYLAIANVFGNEVRNAVSESIDHSTNPPFVPFALGQEKPYKSLVESEASSYYNIVMPYFFESDIFSPRAAPYMDVLNYMWRHQGVMAGLQRFNQHSATYAQDGIHPLYTWGRQFEQIKAHEPKRVVYTFYCALAHGYTRGTYLTGECQGTAPSQSEWYRGSYLPPEPPANGLLLRSLRHMLIHEVDRKQDGIYDELWLLSATPEGWLADGKSIQFERMPSRFGPVSLQIHSALHRGKLSGVLDLAPGIQGKTVLLFVRLPAGYHAVSAAAETGALRPSRPLRPLRIVQRYHDDAILVPGRPGIVHFTVATRR